jgi:hypothetical protein
LAILNTRPWGDKKIGRPAAYSAQKISARCNRATLRGGRGSRNDRSGHLKLLRDAALPVLRVREGIRERLAGHDGTYLRSVTAHR